MDLNKNPFQQLYLTEGFWGENFIELFSDKVLQTAIHPVFQKGNIVLMGPQGCGKSMILHLLKPEVRVAYYEARVNFPIQKSVRNFISAGVNLTQSRISDMAHATLGNEDNDIKEMPLYFGDFFNFLLLDKLLESITTIRNNNECFDSMIDSSKSDEFAEALANDSCWFGGLKNVKNIDELQSRISKRIYHYRSWINGNISSEEFLLKTKDTKTDIGIPISAATKYLISSGMITSKETLIFISIDQLEELHRAFTKRTQNLNRQFRKIINRLFASREGLVNYKVGSRSYGWKNPDFLSTWGSDAQLEEQRDYQIINMQEFFSKGESTSSIFKAFAVDAFHKRLTKSFPCLKNEKDNFAKKIFGDSPSPGKKLAQFKHDSIDDEQIDKDLRIHEEKGWTPEWCKYLRKLYREDRINAVLAAAWGRQTGGKNSKKQHRESPPPPKEKAAWIVRKWWRKERLNQAVLQLLKRKQQRLMWWGFDDICDLSKDNISIFIYICHRIWDGFIKQQSCLPETKRIETVQKIEINKDIQFAGILYASNMWYNKLPEEPGGNTRQQFAQAIGVALNKKMTNDISMSYPGGNGISLPLNENQLKPKSASLKLFLNDATDYGVIIQSEHTSRGNKQLRVKFYLHPILCPRFQLPEARTKEPYYWSIKQMIDFIEEKIITLPGNDSTTNEEYIANVGDTNIDDVSGQQISIDFKDS